MIMTDRSFFEELGARTEVSEAMVVNKVQAAFKEALRKVREGLTAEMSREHRYRASCDAVEAKVVMMRCYMTMKYAGASGEELALVENAWRAVATCANKLAERVVG